jgi:hypothetical protein
MLTKYEEITYTLYRAIPTHVFFVILTCNINEFYLYTHDFQFKQRFMLSIQPNEDTVICAMLALHRKLT